MSSVNACTLIGWDHGFEFRLANECFLASDHPTPDSAVLSECPITAAVTLKFPSMFTGTMGKAISERKYTRILLSYCKRDFQIRKFSFHDGGLSTSLSCYNYSIKLTKTENWPIS